MTYYLAGPMSGHKNFNFDAFHRAAAVLRGYDYDVINPAENFDGKQDLPYDEYLRVAERQVRTEADEGLILLRGWDQSPGALREVCWALEVGRPIESYEHKTKRGSPQNPKDPTCLAQDAPEKSGAIYVADGYPQDPMADSPPLTEWNLTRDEFREQEQLDALGNPLFLALLEYTADIHKRKAAGYSGLGERDTWKNFREAEPWGLEPWQGCAIRLGDKYRRVQNLLRNPENDQVGEPVFDTLTDLANYAFILVCLLWEAQRLQIPEHAVFDYLEGAST